MPPQHRRDGLQVRGIQQTPHHSLPLHLRREVSSKVEAASCFSLLSTCFSVLSLCGRPWWLVRVVSGGDFNCVALLPACLGPGERW